MQFSYSSSIIMEADFKAVLQRVALRTDDIPLGEQTVAQVGMVPFFTFGTAWQDPQ